MNVLATYLLIQVALLISQPSSAPLPRPADLPQNFPTKIWVQEVLRETVSRMWAVSPTFRRQCLEVQAAGAVQVQLRLDPMLNRHPYHRALCELRVYSGGGLIARVTVAAERTAELIAHEMEHVCERLEGIKVEEEARLNRPGYSVLEGTQHCHYETDRAVRVGRQVLAEVDVASVLTRRQ